ncbi:hypothetical protein [Hymenobacter sp. HDW8]|uniref:hypothetical protein n=1 Tax=Hymenobacter sp. HDW8 TaxID=2714932 RepID=UPI00140AEF0F|nr:hypothetical protein [Hymenobacter sp. HDW8]QIL74784.1 hypothetical protein G7064_02090 [Hymenobacter sp. HDW8]
MMIYYRRPWDDSTGDPLSDSWGTSIFYFEVDENGEVLRQIQFFENGRKLKYSLNYIEDEFGMLSDVSLEPEEYKEFRIDQGEFEAIWK